jgi:hypothetical protein
MEENRLTSRAVPATILLTLSAADYTQRQKLGKNLLMGTEGNLTGIFRFITNL